MSKHTQRSLFTKPIKPKATTSSNGNGSKPTPTGTPAPPPGRDWLKAFILPEVWARIAEPTAIVPGKRRRSA